ncbi:putative KilA-N domain-containing protein [Acanthamoeba castellanii mimivirus]|uniref:Putative KilA-N domain-containing protein R878 n=5 Tax=Mimivirus TaxID=315393 RepID=YR878_MIMIV|nr:putative KilA-N domain-containing protein [Acanthamoeba polyphaga mimivirus]Q5URA6.1 RecName: Full=Putative KilA-N domain-containing protein R878 [Acanthamoeba polyphaga mimivirus]AMK62088.1 hypothetical protein [Samba virus]AMZ03316.1 putative KilA-N domain-containing protein [Mimivirus Bombay]BAV62018.1 putative KilA-N domain-containing protein [Acanthamoeba castellanii mimivirus]AAV51136.1 KilA N-terminal domain, N1R/P28 DNA binding [Acanthamoeba polyphaga mimivirus]ADO18918.1 putative 
MKVRKSNNKPLKRSASFTSGTKTGSKSAKSVNSGSKSMKSTKSSSKSYKKIYEEFSDSESSNSEISDNDELSDNEISDNESSDDDEISDNESSDDDEISDNEISDDDGSDNNVYEDNDIRNIIIEDINDNYSKGKFGNFHVVIMKKNGYMNATKLCDNISNKYKNKKFKHWNENKNSKELIEELSNFLKLPKNELIILKKGGTNTEIRGSYAHPVLITHIAYWISPKFAVRIGFCMEEWKKFCEQNELDYYNMLNMAKPLNNNNKEKIIQHELREKYKGVIEIKTKSGYIDLLTDKYLVEIKDYRNWKSAIGQLLVYSVYYPKKIKCMYLFNVESNDINEIKTICFKYDIVLKIYD